MSQDTTTDNTNGISTFAPVQSPLFDINFNNRNRNSNDYSMNLTETTDNDINNVNTTTINRETSQKDSSRDIDTSCNSKDDQTTTPSQRENRVYFANRPIVQQQIISRQNDNENNGRASSKHQQRFPVSRENINTDYGRNNNNNNSNNSSTWEDERDRRNMCCRVTIMTCFMMFMGFLILLNIILYVLTFLSKFIDSKEHDVSTDNRTNYTEQETIEDDTI